MHSKVTLVFLLTTLMLTFALTLHAMPKEGCGAGTCNSCHPITLEEANTLLKDVGEVKEIKPSQVNGLWEVTIERDGQKGVAFLDYGKKHVVAGPIYTLAQIAAASAPQPVKKISADVTIPLENSLIMGNPKGSKRLIVFTDPECPFCDKLHKELVKLVALEPELVVYIKLFPLKMHPKAYDKSRVILGEKSLKLLEKSFAKESLPEPSAKHPAKPIDDTMALAEKLNINATPTIIMPDGQMVEGSRDAETLRKLLNGTK
jgi:thiol:disulfide interchange protein DsbC